MAQNTLEYFTLILMMDMMKKGVRCYITSMLTILKGKQGPVADQFKDSHAYKKFVTLTRDELVHTLESLHVEGIVSRMYSPSKKIYYIKLMTVYADLRVWFNRIFGIPNENSEGLDENLIKGYIPQRSPVNSDTFSEKGTIEIELFHGVTKTIQYESSLEKMFIDDMNHYEYIKDIIEQPMMISRGKNKDKSYTPDFLIQTYHDHQILIEIKPLNEMTTYSVLKNYDLLKNYAYEHNMAHGLITFHEKQWITLSEIENRKTNIELETYVLSRIDKYNEFKNTDYEEAKKSIKCKDLDIHHIILKNKLKKKGKWDNFYITR